jgi:hypothetical protein
MNQDLNDALTQARTELERLAPHWKAVAASGLAAGLIVAHKRRRSGSQPALLSDPIWSPANAHERSRDADLLNQLAQLRHQTAMNTISNIR